MFNMLKPGHKIYPLRVFDRYPLRVYISVMSKTVSTPEVDEHLNHAYTSNKDALLKRLARIEGQVRGITRMVDEEKYCIDILTQISAINAALHKVSLGLVEDHINHCVVDAAKKVEAGEDQSYVTGKVAEVTQALDRLLR